MLLLLYGTFLQHFAGHRNGLFLILPDSLKDTQGHEINMQNGILYVWHTRAVSKLWDFRKFLLTGRFWR